MKKTGEIISHDGETWRILGTGHVRDDGHTYCHLASTTRGRQQRNGWVPLQICDYVDLRDPITAYYGDRSSSGQAALTAHR